MAPCAGVQNVSRPIERCQEMSQMMPTFALVAATSVAATYQGTGAASGAAGAAGVAAPLIALGAVTRAARGQSFAPPLLEDLLHHLVPAAGFCATGTPASATEPVNDGKLYSLLPRTASR